MTIYLKETDGVLTPAPDEYQDETGYYPAFNQNVDSMISKGYTAYDEADYNDYLIGRKTLLNGILTDNPSNVYTSNQKFITIANIQSKIDALDIKRIRAIAEPSVKDETTGQTWLEYYTQQIAELRAQL